MMFESSVDILYMVLAVSVFIFTVFLCWLMYQAARFLKNANDIVESVSQKLEIIVEAVEFIRKKVDSMTSSVGVVSKVVSTIVDKVLFSKLSAQFDDMDLEDDPPKRTKKRKTTRKKKKS